MPRMNNEILDTENIQQRTKLSETKYICYS